MLPHLLLSDVYKLNIFGSTFEDYVQVDGDVLVSEPKRDEDIIINILNAEEDNNRNNCDSEIVPVLTIK